MSDPAVHPDGRASTSLTCSASVLLPPGLLATAGNVAACLCAVSTLTAIREMSDDYLMNYGHIRWNVEDFRRHFHFTGSSSVELVNFHERHNIFPSLCFLAEGNQAVFRARYCTFEQD